LPQWGGAKIEVSVLERDESLLEFVIPELIKHLVSSLESVEETKHQPQP
jgi:hypothetical protein